jgi:hypothetical protein
MLVVLALGVPARFQWWAAALGRTVMVIEAPLSGPVWRLATSLGPSRPAPYDDATRVLEEENERLRGELLRTQLENDRLRQTITDLQSGLALQDNSPVRQLEASVLGAGSDPESGMLTIRAGTQQGVNTDGVALAPGLQLLGRVVAVSERTCTVRALTTKSGEAMTAMIMVNQEVADGLKCTLTPVGDGTLRGPVSDRRDPATNAAITPQPGQIVRLDDPTWPKISRMLKLGVVESVEPNPNQPLRRIVTVRPTVLDLERISDVILWTPIDQAGGKP